jgi:hypothetical protein
MNEAQRIAATDELERILHRSQALADTLDPSRSWTSSDETTRDVVKACDQISSQANRALWILRVYDNIPSTKP